MSTAPGGRAGTLPRVSAETVAVRAGRLLDVASGDVATNRALVIRGATIEEVVDARRRAPMRSTSPTAPSSPG